MRATTGMAALKTDGKVSAWSFARRDLRADDVAVEVHYCGVCASDLAALRGASTSQLPLVPGHEFTGRVTAVGTEVTAFTPGDSVAIGNIVDSCGTCEECRGGFENYCRHYPTATYGGADRRDGSPTQGAWSTEYVARDLFVHQLPHVLDPAAAAPLMCAGITVWEPLQHWGVQAGQRVGIVGLGGLGHLAVKFAKALGAEVTVFTTSAAKRGAAIALGADDVVLSGDGEQLRARARHFDFILDTAGGAHDPSPYLEMLRLHATMCMVGIQPRIDLSSTSLRWGRHRLSGSGTGSPATTRQMLDFAAEHDIVADIELLPVSLAQTALDRLARNDVRWRFVLDVRDGLTS